MFWLFGILLLIEVECSQEEPRCIVPNDHGLHHPDDVLACQSGPQTELCVGEVRLHNVLQAGLEEKCKEEEKGEEKSGCLFLLETSTRDKLTSREACALESAAMRSGKHVVMLRVGPTLDLRDNTTCHVYRDFSRSSSILHINPIDFAKGTPLEDFFEGLALRDSSYRIVHTADALRLLVIARYGGFYSDTDVVFIKSVAELRNVIASDQEVEERRNSEGHLIVGDTVTNALFHFSRGNPIVEMALERFTSTYQGHAWAAAGPDLLQKCLLTLCGFPPNTGHKDVLMTRERFSREQCGGIQVLEPSSFYPAAWMQQSKLTEGRTKKDWEKMFERTYAVHFFHTSSHNHQKIKRPKFYGARKPAYLYLALQHCPISFWSAQDF